MAAKAKKKEETRTERAVNRVTEKTEKANPIENDNLDNNPPGSTSAVNRGVPQRIPSEAKQGGSTPRAARVAAAKEPEAQVVKMMPYKAPNALSDARKAARAKGVGDPRESRRSKSSNDEAPSLSNKAIAQLLFTADNTDAKTSSELMTALENMGVSKENVREVRELMKNPQFFEGDQKPANLQVLGLPPGAQKPPEFATLPGTPVDYDKRYYPTRYAMVPDTDQFEDGDLICSIHEDSSFTVFSVEQQKPDWQQANHTPPLNVVSRVGGSVEDLPEGVVKEGLTVATG